MLRFDYYQQITIKYNFTHRVQHSIVIILTWERGSTKATDLVPLINALGFFDDPIELPLITDPVWLPIVLVLFGNPILVCIVGDDDESLVSGLRN